MMEKTEQGKKLLRFGKKEGTLLVAALLAAAVFRVFHSGSADYLPGIGLTLSQWALMGLTLSMKAGEGKLHFRGNGQGMLLMALSFLLGLCYSLFFDQGLRLLNFPVVVFLSFQALLSVCGGEKQPLSLAGLFSGGRGFLSGLFVHLPLPFRAAVRRIKGKNTAAVFVGIGICIPVMAVVLMLLSSGDQVFGGWLKHALEYDLGSADWLCHLLAVLAVGLPAFSALLHALRFEKNEAPSAARRFPPACFLALLISMTAAYTLFAGVQIRYLFAGQESVYAQGGYAEYARSGFFQLTFVSFITLLAVGTALSGAGESRPVRMLCLIVAALTLVIDFSAFFRMRLYILQYGLSLLRLLTLWAMGVIALCLLGAMVKAIKPNRKVCSVLCAAALCAWVALNLMNPNLLIAKYNVNAYRTGALPEMDIAYLQTLMPDANRVILQIEDGAMLAQIEDAAACQPLPSFYDASVTAWIAGK